MRDRAFDLLRAGVERPRGESVTDPGELPDTVDDLMALRQEVLDVVEVAGRVRREIEVQVAALIGPGVAYIYGGLRLRWNHPSKWRTYPKAVRAFVTDALSRNPEWAEDLFNLNGIRKTGVEKVAKRMGIDPETAVRTILYRDYEPEPRLTIVPVEIGGTDERREYDD